MLHLFMLKVRPLKVDYLIGLLGIFLVDCHVDPWVKTPGGNVINIFAVLLQML